MFFKASLLDEMDPLSSKNKPLTKTPQTFLGENSALVNLDYLIKPNVPSQTNNINSSAYNPFSETSGAAVVPPRNNMFHLPPQPVSVI